MYCGMCDSKNHKFINFEKEEIIIGNQTCREQVEMTVQLLAYLNFLLDDYNNLLAQFLFSCDFKGHYDNSNPPEKKYHFESDIEKEQNIRNCLKYVNTTDWLEQCSFICEKFNILKWNSFFVPKLQKYIHYTEMMNEKMALWDS